MGNEVSFCKDDIQGGLAAIQARLRSGVKVNKRMVFQEDVGPLPKGCKCTPLGFTILSWDLHLLDLFIAAGADLAKPVGLPLRFDFTPLQLAVVLGFTAAVRRLLECGANPNVPFQLKHGTTAPPSQQENHQARPAGSANSPNPPNPNAGSLLPTASLLHQLNCLAHLRAGDAVLHAAIDCAADYGLTSSASDGSCCSRMEVVEALISHSHTDLNRLNGRRRSPLYKACKRRLNLLATLLATHPRVIVNAGWPLFAAIKSESGELVRMLLQAGAGPTSTMVDAQGYHTPLSYALHCRTSSETFHDRADVVAMLVQAGSLVEPEMLSYADERNWHSVVLLHCIVGRSAASVLQDGGALELGRASLRFPGRASAGGIFEDRCPDRGAASVATAATSAISTAVGHCGNANGGVGVGGPGVVSSLTHTARPGTFLGLLVVLWRAYLDIFVAIGAILCARFVVLLLFECAEKGLSKLGIPDRTPLGACLRARAAHCRSRGRSDGGGSSADDRKSTVTVILLMAALALRLFGGMSFLSLFVSSAFIWAVVDSTDVVLAYSRDLRSGQHVGGGGNRSGQRHRSAAGAATGEHDRQGARGNTVLQPTSLGGTGTALTGDIVGGGGAVEAVTCGCDGGSGSGSEVTGGLEGLCCVCMSSRAVMGFVHRDVVHCCMCAECEATLRRRKSIAKCLICKRPASVVVRVIAT
ncbi:hypothetical protein VOLCADRAFT_104175 [Volvox carteri f. nagariensis]|uniref:Uncharacterized protein n=1 Tax=Volvox carteri f. nagariensis TaxID=3068 RepID=D8TRX7_VOLCA|nr:uncharacterized protein VOLCADRAFT_104175 [Volvox carteri f. nagariensis]EFJ49724.1 hypothetical protein VOLCADRAFT_104175 [Volvox carteri f. nagariensis]|eukprot:XP_002949231.1 hypothetical protein VOLCADRAFT_104175 [Volvox carteri f. nagariensis]